MVLREQCAALKTAVDAGIDRVRTPDLIQDYMMSVRFLAIQQFVFLGLQGIEFVLKCILDKCRVPFKKEHNLDALFSSASEKYPYLEEVMQDEFDFWKDTETHVLSKARFLHRESRFSEFLKKIDTHKYQVDTRYFLLNDPNKTSDDRISLLLNSALDPSLLVHLWDILNVFHDCEFASQSTPKVRADEQYFRKLRWQHSPYGKPLMWTPSDNEAKRLVNEVCRCANEYLRTGKAKDFKSIEPAWVRLQQWNKKQGDEDSVWISYKEKRRSRE